MSFIYFLTPEEVKQNGILNANVDDLYIEPALQEAQSIYLREILGDKLYNTLANMIDDETLAGGYQTLVEDYIKPYLGYELLSLVTVTVNFKIRNAGVITQWDNGFSSSTMKDVNYIKEYYDSKAQFYGNRITVYLQKNANDFPEYAYDDENITQPTLSQNVTTLYLGTGRHTGCCCNRHLVHV